MLSGRGSNFLAIAEGIAQGRIPHTEIAVVISNRRDAPGIAAARSAGLVTEVIEPRGRPRAEHDAEIIASLRAHQVDLVCLAGYMRLLISGVRARLSRSAFSTSIPRCCRPFPGLDAQRQALAYGVTVSGCTVHFVDEELDHGVIVLQKAVPVLAGMTSIRWPRAFSPRSMWRIPRRSPACCLANIGLTGRRYVPRSDGTEWASPSVSLTVISVIRGRR
jgi:phosphoribosylglycinamide formyltransferase-1